MAAVHIDGRKMMQHMTIEIDTSTLHREAFGIGGWRLRFARFFMTCAAAVLRCNVRIG